MPLKIKKRLFDVQGVLRLSIPKAIREQLELQKGDYVYMYLHETDGKEIICIEKI